MIDKILNDISTQNVDKTMRHCFFIEISSSKAQGASEHFSLHKYLLFTKILFTDGMSVIKSLR